VAPHVLRRHHPGPLLTETSALPIEGLLFFIFYLGSFAICPSSAFIHAMSSMSKTPS
jgi:hypothetical protein